MFLLVCLACQVCTVVVKDWQTLQIFAMLAGSVSLEVYQVSQWKWNKEEYVNQDFIAQQDLTSLSLVQLASSVVLQVLNYQLVPVVQDTTVMAQQ